MTARGRRDTLVLLGLRCSGKSTVGRLLAEELGRPFVDLDEEVVQVGRQAGWRCATTGELLERAGQALFRDLEAVALRRTLEPSPHIVLASGGGVVERPDNRTWLARAARCVYLAVPLEVLARRMSADPTARPPLVGRDAVAELGPLLARREPLYRALAEAVIECGDDGPAEIVRRTVEALELVRR